MYVFLHTHTHKNIHIIRMPCTWNRIELARGFSKSLNGFMTAQPPQDVGQ